MLKQVTGLEIVEYAIPRTSLRGPFSVNCDTAYVDVRCLKRYKRRYKPVDPAFPLKKYNEQLIRGWPMEFVQSLAREVMAFHA